MAYDATFQNDDERVKEDANPYGQLALPAGPAYSGVTRPDGEALPGTQGPTATGHVNFDQLYSANAGVAGREAAKRQTSAQGKAEGAKAGLTGAQGQFAQGLRTGANPGPSSGDYAYATGARKFDTDSTPMTPGGEQRAETEGEWRSRLEAGAKKGYEGPNALSGMDAYAKLAQDTAAAQDEATTLAGGNEGLQAQGLNQTDAALLGAAGRKGFSELGERYGGLKGQLDKANTESQAQAKAARASAEEGQNLYERLLSDYDAKEAGETDTRKHADDARKTAADKIAQDAATRAKFINYVHGGSEGDHWRNSAHDVSDAVDPVAWFGVAAGEQGLRERAENTVNPMSSTNTSNVWHGWTDDDYDVWAGMSDADWATFAGLGSDLKKRNWIEARKTKLRGGG